MANGDAGRQLAPPEVIFKPLAGLDPVPLQKTSMLQSPFAFLFPHVRSDRTCHVLKRVGAFFTLGIFTVQVFYSRGLNFFKNPWRFLPSAHVWRAESRAPSCSVPATFTSCANSPLTLEFLRVEISGSSYSDAHDPPMRSACSAPLPDGT